MPPPQTKVAVTPSIATSEVAVVITTSIAASYSGFPVKVSPPLDRQLLPSSLHASRRAAPTYRCDLKISYAHLAQMKYIFPEGIQIDKVLIHDKKSLYMKADMKITLVDILEEESNESADMGSMTIF